MNKLSYFEDKFSIVLDSLRSAKLNNRLSHAYIVYSDNPEVRENFALLLAQIILCAGMPSSDHQPPTFDLGPPTSDLGPPTSDHRPPIPCGVCESCKKMGKGIYPDLYILEPTSKTRQIVIGKDVDDPDTIRWFQARFSLSSMSGTGVKIGIIKDADRITPQGQNAFLKNLEEPPKGSFFLLSSGNPHSLLPTVLSRCQLIPLLTNKCSYDFSESSNLFNLLLNIVADNKRNLSSAVELSEQLLGMFNNLRREAEAMVAERWRDRLENLDNLETAARNQEERRYDAATAGEYRLLREVFLNAIYSWFAQVYQVSTGVDPSLLANSEIVSGYINSGLKLSETQALNYLNTAEKFVKNLNWNVNETLAIQEFCLNTILNHELH